jgi:PAS domain S-box-containing protein
MTTRADILVIDDDPAIRETVGDVLKEHGHHVDRVDRGQAALERIVRQRPVDLAIVDYKLPDISGLEVLRSIKARSPETEVILITGHASLDGALAALDGEATSYLVKPVGTAQLLSTVDRALTRQALARALRDSEERYRLVAESMTEALLLLDLDGGLVLMNAYGERLTGYRGDELLGRPIFTLLDRADAARVRERLDAVRSGREVARELECVVVRKDGRRVPVEMVCTSIARDGQVVGRLAVVRDISERKQAQADQALLGCIVESSEEAIIGRTLEGRIVSWNPAAERLFGYPAPEAIGRSVSLIVPPERRDELATIVARLGSGQRVAGYETVRLTKDGRRIDVSLTVSPIKDPTGRVIGASAIARDIGARRRAERTARTLAQVGRELLGTLDLAQIGDRIVGAVLEVFEGRRAALYQLEPASRRLVCVAAAGPGEPGRWIGTHVPADHGVAGQAVAARRVVLGTAGPGDGGPAEEEAGGALIAVPLSARGRVLGALMVSGDRERVYSEAEQELLTVFGDQAALALQNARLFTETERGRRLAERLAGVARSVPQSVTLAELGRRVADGIRGVLDAREAVVYRLDRAAWSLERVGASAAAADAAPAPPVLARGVGLAGLAVVAQQPVVTEDVLGDARVTLTAEMREAVARTGHRAALAVPLLAGGRIAGALVLADRAGRRFSGEDIALARAFADQAAGALENSALFQTLQAALDEVRGAQHELVESERLRAVGSLAAGVTDYVRQVLQMILGQVQLVLPQVEGTESHDRLAGIKATVKEAADVLKRLQVAAELRPVSEAPPLDLNDVARAAIEAARVRRPAPEGATIPVEIELEPGALPPVAGEASVLIEAVTAVLVNAMEALPQGGPVTVRTWATATHVHCAVEDPGIGMSPETRRRALEPFFTTKAGLHKGLGLSVAHGLLRRHGGDIEIASREDKGTVVTVRLPAHPPVPA